MRVRITQAFCEGEGATLNPGYTLDPPESKALEWIALGRAVAIDDEVATITQPSSRPRMLEVPKIFKKKRASR